MQRFLEKMSILSLSFMLVSTFAVSPAMPAMIGFFGEQGYSSNQVAFLITVTPFAIMTTLLLNPLLMRIWSERAIICIGLTLVAVGGAMPLFLQHYPLIFLGRLLLGFGLGMINARAINMVSTHFTGKERLQMMGLRGSTEVLGSASLTAIVGLLLGLGWQMAFAIYLLAFVVLALYLKYVPEEPEVAGDQGKADLPSASLTPQAWKQALGLALVAFFVINVNSALTLKIPVMVQESGLGTPQQASWILSAMMLMGIVAGTAFSPLLGYLKEKLLPIAVLVFSLCILLASLPSTLWLLSFGAILSGFFYSIVLTVLFNTASEKTPKHLLNTVMTIVLIGCNTGGATSSVFPPLLETLTDHPTGAFGIYAVIGVVVSVVLFWKSRASQKAFSLNRETKK